MSSNKCFLPTLSNGKASPKQSKTRSPIEYRQKGAQKIVLSPPVHGSPEHCSDWLPSLAVRPSSSNKAKSKKSVVMPMLEQKERHHPVRLLPSPPSIKAPGIQHNNGITRARTPAYMRTQARTHRIPTPSGSPDAIRSGRKIGVTLPWLD